MSNLLARASSLSCLSADKQSSYFCGQLVFPAGLSASDGGCVIDIANQDWSRLDQYEVRESLFNQDLTCSLLREQWSVKWHNSLKTGMHTHTHTQKTTETFSVHPLCTLCYNYLTHTCAHTKMETAGDVSTCGNFQFVTHFFTHFLLMVSLKHYCSSL